MTKMDFQENESYVEGLLKLYGFKGVRRSHNGFTASCPFHEDKHPSFSISRTGLWMCWSCKARGNLKHLHKVMGGGEQDWRDSLKAMGVQLRASNHKAKPKTNPKIDLPWNFAPYESEAEVPACILRRLSWETIHLFGLGSVATTRERKDWMLIDRCIIPIRYHGETVGWHGRALMPGQEPRYYNPAGFDIKEHVFNYDSCQVSGEVILVEGAFNAMSMLEKGYPNTMAVFGTQFTTSQLKRIFTLNPKKVVICFDRDASKIVDGQERGKQGQKAAHKLGKLIHDAVPTFIMPLPVGKDPNDLPRSVLRQCHDKCVPYEKVFGDDK